MSVFEELRQLGFTQDIDSNLKLFCKTVAEELRDERDCVIGITGYPGTGKSNIGAIIGALIDKKYNFDKNICFIPTSKQIEEQYMNLPMYSVLHIDEASRGLHKHKWHDKVQQKLNQLYDTEREGHFLCTLLLMPRFQNFSENFRNFRIKYWINVIDRGLCIVYKRDEDKDCKDPWHLDENYKIKMKKWKGKKVYERGIPHQVRIEQETPNYWFYFKIPPVPEEVWKQYQELKRESRLQTIEEEREIEVEEDPVKKYVRHIKENYVSHGVCVGSRGDVAASLNKEFKPNKIIKPSTAKDYIDLAIGESKLEINFENGKNDCVRVRKANESTFYNKLDIDDLRGEKS